MTQADTAPLKVLSAGAVEYIITRLAPGFTDQTGVQVSFTFGTIGRVKQRLAAGEAADIVIGTTPAIQEMEKAGAIVAGSRVELGRTLTGLCVRNGAALPDISTPEAFKSALLAARSFAYTDPSVGGTSGVFLTGLMKQLGILEQMTPKAVLCINGEDVVDKVSSGKAELGSTFLSEFKLGPGVASAGALPAAIGNATSYSAAVLAVTARRDEAARFIAMLTAPAQRAAWSAGGFEPPT